MGRKKGEVIDMDNRDAAPVSYADLARPRLSEAAENSPELFDSDLNEQQQVLPSALQGVLAELGAADDQAKVTVNKLESQNGQRKTVWLFECHPSAFNFSDIQDYYGAGDYQIVVYGNQPGTKYRVIHANKRVTIGVARDGKAPAGAAAFAVAGSPPVTVHNDTGAAIAKAMSEAFAPIAATLAALVSNMQKAPGTRAEMLAEMKEILALAGMNRPAPDLITQLTQAKAIADLFKGGASSAGLDDESGPWAVLNSAVNQLGGPLGELMREKLAEKRAEPQPALPAPASPPATPPAAAGEAVNNAGATEVENVNALALRLQVGILLNAAKNGMDTGTYADLIFEQAPDAVLAALAAPDWHAQLVAIEPAFAEPSARTWAEKCRAEVLEAMKEDGLLAPDGAKASLTEASPAAKSSSDGGVKAS